jgi:hypothetical protein
MLLNCVLLGLLCSCAAPSGGGPSAARLNAPPRSKLVFPGPDGKLRYVADENGNTIPDFSNCGYHGGGVRIPDVATKVTVEPERDSKDDTARIQRAIDEVAKLPRDEHGFRGAVLLKRGQYRIGEQPLRVSAAGIVLRGEGDGEDGTVLIATGKKQRDVVEVKGASPAKEMESTRQPINESYFPVGARSFTVADASGFKVGDTVIVRRVGNQDWIHYIKMDQITVRPNSGGTRQWEPFDLNFNRVITAIDGRAITIDAPITCAIESRWGGGTLAKSSESGLIDEVGVENIRAVSEYDASITRATSDDGEKNVPTYASDEQHAMQFVSFDNVKNAWARNLTAQHFYHGISHSKAGAKWVTIQDSKSIDPVSVLTGGRRYPFNVNGQLILHLRCYSRDARHAFVVGSHVCGPNAFVECTSERDHATSEPHHRWSVGGLYDNVKARMAFQDRQYYGSGHGWAGANYVAWNCEGTLICQQPPTAQNWAIGFVGEKRKGAFEPKPDGYWESLGQHVEPRSLYTKQLEDRLGERAVTNVESDKSFVSPRVRREGEGG